MEAGARIETSLKGLPLSDGMAVARVCMFNESRHNNLPSYRVTGSGVPHELERFERAVAVAAGRLEEIQRRVSETVGKAEAGIFVAQQMILQDPGLLASVQEGIRTHSFNAENAVIQALDSYEARLLALDNEYLKERASDFGETKRRLLDVLADLKPSLQCDERHCQKGRNRIIVAEELTPTLTVELDTEHTMGFVTERGGRESHAAILARALRIPAVSGIAGIRDKVACGAEILVNGTTGEVVLWPSEATILQARLEKTATMRMPLAAAPVPGFRVLANINLAGDVRDAVSMQAEGVGLYRTELDLITAGRLLTEDELYRLYRGVQEAMGGRPVVYRLFDVGSDKPLPFLEVPREENPALGWRGARLLLDRPDLLRTQARALARVSAHGPVGVLYPMITGLAQFRRLRQVFAESLDGIRHGELSHGVMLEVPSACLSITELLGEADFASIGTNDLVQYLLAVDRNNARVAADYDVGAPVLWQLIGTMVQAAGRAGKPLSVCGEIGADPLYIPRLIDAGIRTVSLSPRGIPNVRAAAQKKLAGSPSM